MNYPEWIPCEERLPNPNGAYLVTTKSALFGGRTGVEIMYFGDLIWPEKHRSCWYWSDIEYGDVISDEVVAWMPLPEPWKGRGNDK